MTEDTRELQARYSRIGAPPEFAAQLHSTLRKQATTQATAETRSPLTWIVGWALVATLVAVVLYPMFSIETSPGAQGSSLSPSLVTMARLKPARPVSVPTMSLSGLPSLRLPSLPKAPLPLRLDTSVTPEQPKSVERVQEKHTHAIT